MKKKHLKAVSDAVIASSLKSLVWNYDMQNSHKQAKDFIIKLTESNSKLKSVKITGVFQGKGLRDELREKVKEKGIELILFEPQFTDDESEDASENESVSDGKSTEEEN